MSHRNVRPGEGRGVEREEWKHGGRILRSTQREGLFSNTQVQGLLLQKLPRVALCFSVSLSKDKNLKGGSQHNLQAMLVWDSGFLLQSWSLLLIPPLTQHRPSKWKARITALWSESCSVMSNSFQPCGLYSPRNSSGQNTGVGSPSLLQGVFPTQGSNPGLLHQRWIIYQVSHKESPTLQFSSVQFSWSVVSDSATPWTVARQVSLSITNSRSLLKLMSIESVMPSSHLILCRSLLLPPSIFSSIRVFSNESALRIRWPKY